MFPVARWRRLRLNVALTLGLVGRADLHNMPVQQPAEVPPLRLVVDSTSPASIQPHNPDDYVQVHGGKLMLAGKPFVIRGTNYFGSWRHHYTLKWADGIERGNMWAFYHEWDAHKLDLDFQFMYSQLHATAVRIGTPSILNFENAVKYNGYEPWFNADGTITDRYKDELVQLADTAYANGVRIQLCLLWFLYYEIAKDGEAFIPGGRLDQFYSNHVRSIGLALRNHPGIMSFSIGNEVLINWPINGTHGSWYEGRAGGFILRRLNDLRATAPLQLLTIDETAAPEAKNWHDPGPEFALLPDVDNSNGGKQFRLADKVDYLAPHFYPERLTTADLRDGFALKIEDAKKKLRLYMRAANAVKKPVAIGEFGLVLVPPTLSFEQYSAARDMYFEQFLAEGEKLGLQGLLAWGALPAVALKQGHYSVRLSNVSPYSPTEVDVDNASGGPRRILSYEPSFSLFVWRDNSDVPSPTPAARAIASAWPGIPQPRGHASATVNAD